MNAIAVITKALVAIAVTVLVLSASPATLLACPFCPQVSLSLARQIRSADVAVIARLVHKAPPPRPKDSTARAIGEAVEKSLSTFQIVRVVRGGDQLGKAGTYRVLYIGKAKESTLFLGLGVKDKTELVWQPGVEIGPPGPKYVDDILRLPEKGADRLAYFQDYLEHPHPTISEDAFAEFARAPYKEIGDLKDRMNHDQLVAWIKDPETTTTRRRLYLTMLGVCGQRQDVAMLESMITSPDEKQKRGLDAMIACYLMLTGADGMPLVEELFLRGEMARGRKVLYQDTYAAIQALRFHGEEASVIERRRLLSGLRHMLDRPLLADLVIPDLARWQDWTAVEPLVKLFKEADAESRWVRVPVVRYLQVCPLPAAKKHLQELSALDPGAARQALTFPFGGPRPAEPKSPQTAVPLK